MTTSYIPQLYTGDALGDRRRSTAPSTVRGDRSVGLVPSPTALFVAVAVVVAGVALVLAGVAAAVPLALIRAIAAAAAVGDIASGRIPNAVVLTSLVVVAAGWGFVATIDHRPMLPLLWDMAVGLLFSGAPLMFVVWLVAPRLIGGGDWKLLAVLGLTVGMVAPGQRRSSQWSRSPVDLSAPPCQVTVTSASVPT